MEKTFFMAIMTYFNEINFPAALPTQIGLRASDCENVIN